MVGAGVGGLAVAARLAHAGHDVVVCEQAAVVGGKLGLVEDSGFRFDTGPSLLTMPQLLAETWDATGGMRSDDPPLVEVDPIAAYRYPDGTAFAAHRDSAAFAAELDAALHQGAGADWLSLEERAAAIWEAVAEPVLGRRLDGWRALLRLARRLDHIGVVAPWQTLAGLGRRQLRDERLRTFLARYATYTGSDPRRAPAALAAIPHAERAFGAWYVPGGLHRLADALTRRIADAGGQVRTGARVVAVTVAGGCAAGVELAGGERVTADAVVANADAAQVYGELVPATVGASEHRRLRRIERSYSAYVVLLGVEGRTPGLHHHTVLFAEDYDAEFDALAAGRYVADPTVYLSVPDDPAVAPEGCEAWFVLVNAPRSDQAAPPADYADRLLDLLAARGLDVRDRVRLRRIRTPRDLADATLTPGGAIYGTSSNGPLAAFLRPRNVADLRGLYLVGGSAHPGGGLPLVLLSARIVADELC